MMQLSPNAVGEDSMVANAASVSCIAWTTPFAVCRWPSLAARCQRGAAGDISDDVFCAHWNPVLCFSSSADNDDISE